MVLCWKRAAKTFANFNASKFLSIFFFIHFYCILFYILYSSSLFLKASNGTASDEATSKANEETTKLTLRSARIHGKHLKAFEVTIQVTIQVTNRNLKQTQQPKNRHYFSELFETLNRIPPLLSNLLNSSDNFAYQPDCSVISKRANSLTTRRSQARFRTIHSLGSRGRRRTLRRKTPGRSKPEELRKLRIVNQEIKGTALNSLRISPESIDFQSGAHLEENISKRTSQRKRISMRETS